MAHHHAKLVSRVPGQSMLISVLFVIELYLVPLLFRKALQAELKGLIHISASIEAASQELEQLAHALGVNLELHLHDLPRTTAPSPLQNLSLTLTCLPEVQAC